MNWVILFDIVYVTLVFLVCLRIIYDTDNVLKTLAYLLLAVFVPLVGIAFYFSFGVNYRKRKMYSKKLVLNNQLWKTVETRIQSRTYENLTTYSSSILQGDGLVKLLVNDWSPLTGGNSAKILINGEETFPELLSALRGATHHIHIQYYIFEDDIIGNKIKDILIEKAKQGVKVRFVYDDFGSHSISGKVVTELKAAGIEVFPFNRIYLFLLANRLNYRNHRRIVVIDGRTAFTGGVNVSDRYINGDKNQQYWRDTHLRIDGTGCYYLQYLFLCDWNFASGQQLEPQAAFFNETYFAHSATAVQIAASGPDSSTATIMLSFLKAISIAQHSILITTPYFIPGDSILDALRTAALSGVSVSLLVPDVSDSWWVNMAARSFYTDLLKVGVNIYLYQKGFVHSKTMVIDDNLSIVGTANFDNRSFDLNFEVNAILFDLQLAKKLKETFAEDILFSKKIDQSTWRNRKYYTRLAERIARLLSPLM